MDQQAIQKIRELKASAASIGGYFAKHKATIAHSQVDKHGAAFEARTDRFVGFHLNVTFSCHTGRYGSSSCGVDLYVRTEDVQPYFIRAMAKHQELLFATAAELMRADAVKLADKAREELAAMAAMVDALDAPTEAEAS